MLHSLQKFPAPALFLLDKYPCTEDAQSFFERIQLHDIHMIVQEREKERVLEKEDKSEKGNLRVRKRARKMGEN